MLQNSTKAWTIRELMKSAIEHLQKKGFEEARLNVELLLAHALKLQRIQLYLNFDKPLTQTELNEFRSLYERRLKHEPVQYIVGSVNFMGLSFIVNSNVLIPRPETETLVEQAMMFCQRYSHNERIEVLEIGTGCGNIAVSIAKYVKNAFISTMDKSQDALDIAELNIKKHNVESRVKLICWDFFDESRTIFSEKFDLIVSNPPYIPKDEWEQLQKEVKEYEPLPALTDGKDGFSFYYQISKMATNLLKVGGGIILEVGFGQAQKVVKELRRSGFNQLKVVKDLQGISRVVLGEYSTLPINRINLN